MADPAPSDAVQPNRLSQRAVRFAWVAARLHGVAYQGVPAWAEERLGRKISARAFESAVGPIRGTSDEKGQRGRPGQRRAKERPVISEATVVDEEALGIRKVLFRLANDGMPQRELLIALQELPGLRQIIETSADRELLALALVRTDREARDLRARIEELAPGRPVRMDLVEMESSRSAPRTWLEIARREAQDLEHG